MTIFQALREIIGGLRRDERGLAAVEFALILPIMAVIYIGSVETSTLIVIDRKVQSVAGSLGDLVARTDRKLAASDLRDYFRAASGIMTPYPTAGMLQVVTAISVSDKGETSVLWSAKFKDGVYTASSQYTKGGRYPLPQAMIDISKKQTVIAAEASYSYAPLFGLIIEQPINLYRSNFFLPRYDGSIDLGS